MNDKTKEKDWTYIGLLKQDAKRIHFLLKDDVANRICNLINEKLFALGVRDDCEICKGEKGGIPGNENVITINGEQTTVCDYCTPKP